MCNLNENLFNSINMIISSLQSHCSYSLLTLARPSRGGKPKSLSLTGMLLSLFVMFSYRLKRWLAMFLIWTGEALLRHLEKKLSHEGVKNTLQWNFCWFYKFRWIWEIQLLSDDDMNFVCLPSKCECQIFAMQNKHHSFSPN